MTWLKVLWCVYNKTRTCPRKSMLFGMCATTQSSHRHWNALWEYTKHPPFCVWQCTDSHQVTEQCRWGMRADSAPRTLPSPETITALLTRGLTSSWFQDYKLKMWTHLLVFVQTPAIWLLSIYELQTNWRPPREGPCKNSTWTTEILCFRL